jgi:hypothetical protein
LLPGNSSCESLQGAEGTLKPSHVFDEIRWMEEILHQLMGGLSFVPLLIGVQPSKVVQDLFHPQ